MIASFCVLFLKVPLLLRYFYRLLLRHFYRHLSFALGKFTRSFCKNVKSVARRMPLLLLLSIALPRTLQSSPMLKLSGLEPGQLNNQQRGASMPYQLVKSYQILGADFNEEIFSEENDVVKRWTIASFSIRNHPLFGGFAEEERARKSTMPKSSSKSPRGCESERVLLAIGKSSGNGTTVARKRQRCCRFRKNKTTMALFAPFDTTN